MEVKKAVIEETPISPDVLETPVEAVAESEAQAPQPTPTAPAQPTVDYDKLALEREKSWMQQQYQQLNERLRQAQHQLGEYELANLDPEQAANVRMQRAQQELEEQKAQFEAQQALQQWREYYAGMGATPEMLQTNDPVTWQHNLLTHYRTQQQELLETVKALKAAQTQPDAPKVTRKQGGAAPKKKQLWDFSLDEIDKMLEEKMYNPDSVELPPIE